MNSKGFKSIIALALSCCLLVTPPIKAEAAGDYRTQIAVCEENQRIAHDMAECARALGYAEDSTVIKEAKSRWTEEQKMKTALKESLARKRAEYPAATEIYESLRDRGLSEVCAAAILGNVMRETGGDTLAVKPCIYASGGTYYGMCMWALTYTPQVRGLDIEGQIDVLMSTMPRNMQSFGGSYETFCATTDVGAAAKYFNTYYERGAHGGQRAANAKIALNYFCGS